MYKIEISMSCNRQQRDELVSAMNTKKINYIKSSFVDLDGWQNGWFWFVRGGFLRGDYLCE
ncbi:hypothetical protein [uncultured Gammaproteobacteria bacterium]|nr:hypothetical protein [uncultured Gammaproteobacteria bacterium]